MNEINEQKINVSKIQTDAEQLMSSGGFNCSEAVVLSIRNNIDSNMPVALVSAATGFAGGVGRAKCMCGAVSGAVICLGYFMGRLYPTTPTDPKSLKTLSLSLELVENFKKNHKVLCCAALSKNKEGDELKAQCAAFAGETAVKAAEIIIREFNLKAVGKESAK